MSLQNLARDRPVQNSQMRFRSSVHGARFLCGVGFIFSCFLYKPLLGESRVRLCLPDASPVRKAMCVGNGK